MCRAAAPDALEELVARQHPTLLTGKRVDKAKLGRRELCARAVHVRLDVVGIEAKLLDDDLVAAPGLGVAHPAAGGYLHPRRELLQRERLDEVVVGADLERVHAVVLRPPRGDDDDRCADPLRPRLLDDAPTVDPGKHEIEHADVRALVAEAGEPGLAVGHADGVEARRLEVSRHPARDDVVVLDYQDLRHSAK